MLTRATRIKVLAFALIGIIVLAYTGFHYANLGRYLGLRGYYVVKLDLANSGGLFPHADVTYRGVSVGRVGDLHLTSTGVEADLNISDAAPKIPAHLHAAVADLTAVGEQYVDLRPAAAAAAAGPYLTGGSVIPERDTELPLPVTTVLESVDSLATSLPLPQLRTLMNALGAGFANQGSTLAGLVDGQSALVQAANATIPQTKALISDGRLVLATQISEGDALNAFGKNAALLAHRLRQSDSSIGKLLTAGPQAAAQIAGLITDNDPGLGVLIANLLTTSEVTLTRGAALDELLSALPAAVAAGSTVITPKGARFGVALTFFKPMPCTTGYGGTVYRNGLDTTPGPALNKAARCALPASSGVDVRGSAHAPPGGGVPPAAAPGLAGLLGLTP
jgi:phospholipid/cholesterol/gamma-HCH transport system substrate-binding protein